MGYLVVPVDYKCRNGAALNDLCQGFFAGQQGPGLLGKLPIVAVQFHLGFFFFGFVPQGFDGADDFSFGRANRGGGKETPAAVFTQGGKKDLGFVGAFGEFVGDVGGMLASVPVLVVTMAFISLLVTRIGVLLQALYLAGDMDFLISAPVPVRAVFIAKMLQAILQELSELRGEVAKLTKAG